MTLPMILDCDPGNDDALGILVACGAAGCDLRAVTTGAGHLDADRTARNAAITLTLARHDEIPVARGSASPLVRERMIARLLDMNSALDPERPDLAAVPLATERAVPLMGRLLAKGPATIVTTGPMTNLALLLRQYPEVSSNITRVVSLAGTWGLGTKTAAAEWNVLCDPEAAAIVFDSGLPITLIPIDASNGAGITPDLIARARALGTRAGDFAAELMASLVVTFHPGLFAPPHMPINDPLATLVALDASLAETVPARVDVELAGRHTYGRTVIDFAGRTGQPNNCDVVIALDETRVHDALIAALAQLA